MLRNPITLVASLIMLAGVGVLNYLHFTGSGESVDASPAVTGPDGDTAQADLDLLVERLAELRKPRSGAARTGADLAGLTRNPFLYPEERRAGKSLRELEQELTSTSPVPTPREEPLSASPRPDAAVRAEVLKQLATVELTAIIWSEDCAVAVLGGEILRPGDSILGGRARVARIGPAAVELEVFGEPITKRLKPFEAVQPPELPTKDPAGGPAPGVATDSTSRKPGAEAATAGGARGDG